MGNCIHEKTQIKQQKLLTSELKHRFQHSRVASFLLSVFSSPPKHAPVCQTWPWLLKPTSGFTPCELLPLSTCNWSSSSQCSQQFSWSSGSFSHGHCLQFLMLNCFASGTNTPTPFVYVIKLDFAPLSQCFWDPHANHVANTWVKYVLCSFGSPAEVSRLHSLPERRHCDVKSSVKERSPLSVHLAWAERETVLNAAAPLRNISARRFQPITKMARMPSYQTDASDCRQSGRRLLNVPVAFQAGLFAAPTAQHSWSKKKPSYLNKNTKSPVSVMASMWHFQPKDKGNAHITNNKDAPHNIIFTSSSHPFIYSFSHWAHWAKCSGRQSGSSSRHTEPLVGSAAAKCQGAFNKPIWARLRFRDFPHGPETALFNADMKPSLVQYRRNDLSLKNHNKVFQNILM